MAFGVKFSSNIPMYKFKYMWPRSTGTSANQSCKWFFSLTTCVCIQKRSQMMMALCAVERKQFMQKDMETDRCKYFQVFLWLHLHWEHGPALLTTNSITNQYLWDVFYVCFLSELIFVINLLKKLFTINHTQETIYNIKCFVLMVQHSDISEIPNTFGRK